MSDWDRKAGHGGEPNSYQPIASAADDPDFPGFVALLTNGEADHLFNGYSYAPLFGLGGGTFPEADGLGRNPDLHGNQITKITLTLDGLWLDYDGNRTFGSFHGIVRIYGKPLAQ